MKTAKLFQNGRSQAVRLPQEFRFDGDEVAITKVGDMVILLPCKKGWKLLAESLQMFSEDFMEDRNQPPSDTRKEL